jgi:hypothetical protein
VGLIPLNQAKAIQMAIAGHPDSEKVGFLAGILPRGMENQQRCAISYAIRQEWLNIGKGNDLTAGVYHRRCHTNKILKAGEMI